MDHFDTAGVLINRAARELGLGTVADPFLETNPHFQQLVGLLTTCGQDLVSRFEWRQLLREHVFVTDALDTGDYELPRDYHSLIPQSIWDRTGQFPVLGPLSVQGWQAIKAWAAQLAVTLLFRIDHNQLRIYPQPPPAGLTVALEFKSKAWVIPSGVPPGNFTTAGLSGADEVTLTGDVVLFDPVLIVRYLKLEFRKARGFDTTAEQNDFDDALERAKGRATSAPVLTLNGPKLRPFRWLDEDNLPDTGYGS